MRRYKGTIIISGLLIILLGSGCQMNRKPEQTHGREADSSKNIRVLCSFLPMWVLTKNVVGDREGVEVDILIPGHQGPHDYALTPGDMKKISQADLLVFNGLFLEEFLTDVAKNVKPGLKILEAARAVEPVFIDGDEETHDAASSDTDSQTGHECPHADNKFCECIHRARQKDGHEADHECPYRKKAEASGHHHHGHTGINPHAFASPRDAAKMAISIAEALAEIDPEGADDYKKNAHAYAARLETLADDLRKTVQAANNKKVVTFHNAFDYLARDTGLEIVGVLETVPGQAPSAGELSRLVKTIKESGAVAVFAEPQFSPRLAKTLADEAGVGLHALDPAATGELDPGIYEETMKRNLETLKKALRGEG